jgi:DNA-damage-inducible protein D
LKLYCAPDSIQAYTFGRSKLVAELEERMETEKSVAFFENFKIRRVFDEKSETWLFSVVDVVRALIQQPTHQAAANYWKVLKHRLRQEGSQLVTNCNQLKMKASDGKEYLTDVADAENLLRLVQSVPSPKAEPLKLWLAKVGHERLKDMADPVLSLDRAREYWKRQGRSEKWVQQRMMGQETRNKLTDYWKNHEIKGEDEYALLTDLIHREWAEVTVKDHKKMKGLKTQNLRDHMSEAELIFTALAELSTRQIAESVSAVGLEPNKEAGKKGGGIARGARLELESKTGRRVVTGDNFLPPRKNSKKLGRAKGLPKKS